ncbi:carboxypeptidase-like regulatory domain-containing protein [uncultured Kriegella sp.]|uniref:carboxypeptidase-like regulatory domain-containing protein n=1 Tax=uncultured Kriegella sp. TaxID=1798910 RepID=UPI0030DBA4CB|tara:strand:- start:150963 stop:151829 length:867 start_codon:yes stop_codon:yes gene_type:complete
MKFVFFCVFLANSLCYPQHKNIEGVVKSYENDAPLPYVNIGIAHKAIGTVSDKNGFFSLSLNDNATQKDSVTFSYVGFRTKKYATSELNNKHNIILLHPESVELNEVVVSSTKIKRKPKKIGRSSKGLGLTHMNFYSYNEKDVDDRLSKEVGMKFKIKSSCHIKDLNFKITSNDFTSLKFRLNFYKIIDGLPSNLLINKNVVFEVKNNFIGWFKVNLEPHEIYLEDKTEAIAVSIQWLESVKENNRSKYFAISTAASPLHTAYYREKTMDTWSKSGQSLSFYLNALCE